MRPETPALAALLVLGEVGLRNWQGLASVHDVRKAVGDVAKLVQESRSAPAEDSVCPDVCPATPDVCPPASDRCPEVCPEVPACSAAAPCPEEAVAQGVVEVGEAVTWWYAAAVSTAAHAFLSSISVLACRRRHGSCQ